MLLFDSKQSIISGLHLDTRYYIRDRLFSVLFLPNVAICKVPVSCNSKLLISILHLSNNSIVIHGRDQVRAATESFLLITHAGTKPTSSFFLSLNICTP